MHGKRMLRRHASKSLILVMLAIGTACQKKEPPPPPPPEIPVVSPIQRDQPILLEAIGETMGSVDIPIRARVEGYLEGMFFDEGWPVEKDQLLYTIDPQPFEAAVVEARGQLAEARTMLAKAKSDLDRIRPLAEMKAVSEQDLDGAVAEYEAAIGAVDDAIVTLQEAAASAHDAGAHFLELRAVTSLASLLADLGRPDDGKAVLGPVLAAFDESPDVPHVAAARMLLGGS